MTRRSAPSPASGIAERRFADKAAARDAVWHILSEAKVARFPFPVKGRIPNFAGADAAAARLLSHPIFASATCVKVNPDSPQRYVRKGLLERGIAVITPTPRLRGGFFLLDPQRIPADHHWDAAGMRLCHSKRYSGRGGCAPLRRVNESRALVSRWGRTNPLSG